MRLILVISFMFCSNFLVCQTTDWVLSFGGTESDKGISIGENSYVEINNINLSRNNVALAVKDGSIANIKNVNLTNNNYDIALFNKKQEFTKPKLILAGINKLDSKKILQSRDTILIINDNKLEGSMEDSYINSTIY